MLCKKLLLPLFLTAFLLVSNVLFAHNPDFSSIIISKTENGQIVMQLNSSLTAFQQEVNYVNGEGAYASPEEFQDLVLQLFKSRFSIVLNQDNPFQFKNTKVFLGHETKIVSELIGLPKEVNHIYLKNEVFKDLHNSQSVVVFLLDGFPKERFNLLQNNQHEVNITLEEGKWIEPIKQSVPAPFKYLPYLITLMIGGFLFFVSRK
ncbi:hypothetical protein [Maribacter sp. Asnod1-A12]|uniref:hypothetical protein n=1 Tax=Maribacter sp. Asnod1-A12 TaxID=3160576 RepID=UPI003866EA33